MKLEIKKIRNPETVLDAFMLVTMEEGKDCTVQAKTNQSRILPQRLLYLIVPFSLLCFAFSVVSICMIWYFGVYNVVATASTNLQLYIEEPRSYLDGWITPPLDLLHKMTDEELLWRASFVSKLKEYPLKREPKIAFMFLTRGPLPLAPLWERFFQGYEEKYSIYIHPSPSFEVVFDPSSVFYKRQIPSQLVEWGKMSICDAERRLLANALLDISNERFVLLSESSIPLHNFTVIYDYITKSNHSFMDAFDDPGRYGRGRYNENMAPEVNITLWRKGSQWFEVNRKLALTIVEDKKYYQKFSDFCHPGCYVDEHYYPTMLTILAPIELANRSITWADWSRRGPHPATFGTRDITDLFLKRVSEGQDCFYNNQATSLCFLFARKFAPSALEPLLLVAQKHFGY